MGAKPKAASWWSRNKKLVIVACVSVVAIFLLGFLYYQSQRPNYRDLEKEFSKLQIPSDWVLVSQSGTKGYKGLFCFTSGIDEACPMISKSFKSSQSVDPTSDMQTLKNQLSSLGVSNYVINDSACVVSANVNYFCSITGSKNGITFTVTIGTNSRNEKILRVFTE